MGLWYWCPVLQIDATKSVDEVFDSIRPLFDCFNHVVPPPLLQLLPGFFLSFLLHSLSFLQMVNRMSNIWYIYSNWVLFDVFHHPEETKWSVILDIWNASCHTCSQVMAMRRNWQKLSSNITSMGLQWPSSTESQRSFFLQDTQTFLLLFHPSRMICAGFNWEHMCRWEAHCEYAHTCILGFSFILP